MAAEHGICTIGNIIDSTYRGEVHAILCNTNQNDKYQVEEGDKIAQMLIMPCYTGMEYSVVKELSTSARGQAGFGSSGR
jgi:dUTP pyrophosphatase